MLISFPEVAALFSHRILTVPVRVTPLVMALLMVISCAKIVRHPDMEIGKEVIVLAEMKATKAPEKSVHLNKNDFFALMRPIIKTENARILQIRRHLVRLQSSARLRKQEIIWLRKIAGEYRVPFNGKPDNSFWHQLLTRVDIVPLEMAMAQAANESAWGNSRFAREANNYFGQWCFQQGCGLVPLRRNEGAHHEVKRFDSPAFSVRAYLSNMNTHRVYQAFRSMRRSLRRHGKALDAEFLALGLKQYSERGADYVKTIRTIIRKNRKLMRNI